MNVDAGPRHLSLADMQAILAVTSKLAAPFDLTTMLNEVVSAAKQVLRAERGSVWLYDAEADQLVLEIATGMPPLRVPLSAGIAGACARDRAIINVPDCYADQRFNPEVDRRSGFRTRCMLTLPLVDHKDVLVGVMQVLNKVEGVFDANDEALAITLAAQCAVALQRVRMTAALIEGEKMRQELEMARIVQMSMLPATMPEVPGYDLHGHFQPASLTGGDTFDLSLTDQGLLTVLGDATGHGIAPALSVAQLQAMLRMAFRLGADLETAFIQVNNQLAGMLADDRFITAFVGLLDASAHRMRFHSGGQAPILHYRADAGQCVRYNPTSFPLAAMPLTRLRPATVIDLAPGDILVLLSDGIYEYHDAHDEQFGEARVEAVVRLHGAKPMAELSALLLDAVREFARGAPQEDDITVVLVKRDAVAAGGPATRSFRRSIDALDEIFTFTAASFARLRIDPGLLGAVDLMLEELFTNMVKYSPGGGAEVRVDIGAIPGGVEAAISDYDVERFDVTRAPDPAIDLPLAERRPGGLGLHLIRKLADHLAYDYSEAERRSRITFRKTNA
jgi:phosphoserine phosphatase